MRTSRLHNGNGEAYAVSPDGKGLRWLTENDVPDGDPAWSPTGRQLTCESSRQRGSRSTG